MQAPKPIQLFQYGFLALPLAFAGLPLYIHAPDFYTRDLGVSIGLLGTILLVIRLFDAIQDPVIGYLVDKYANKRFLFMTGGTLCLISGMLGVFSGPPSILPAPIWFALTMVLATTGFSILSINLNMIGGFWSNDANHRTTISAWRESFALCGLLIASILPVALQHKFPAEEAYILMALSFTAIMGAALLFFRRFMRDFSKNEMKRDKTSKGFSFFLLLLGPEKRFYAACFLTHLAAAFPGVLVLFFIRDFLQAESFAGLFLILYFISGALLIPIWVKLAGQIGKYKTWFVSMVLSVATFGWAFFLQPGDLIAYGIICVLSGLALGADLALPPSILADRITKQKGESEATQYYAVLAFLPKIAIALASGLAFTILGETGFKAGNENDYSALQTLIILYALVPCAIKLAAAGLLWEEKINTK